MMDSQKFGTPRLTGTPRRAAVSALAAALLLLCACGGGGGGDGGSSSEAAPPPPSPPADIRLSGTAATGAAMAGATVRLKCVAGSGAATTSANGSYTIDVAAASLPCVLSATSADGATVLHSLVSQPGPGINITPATELLVAHAAGSTPAAFFGAFDATAAARLTPTARFAAQINVAAALGALGVDIAAIGDPITAPLVAATSTTPGNAYDQALDALAASLRGSGTTLAQLAAQLVASSLAAPVVTAIQFFPAGPASPQARLEVMFSQPMTQESFTTGAYVPARAVWETNTKFVLPFISYSSGGTITLKAPNQSDGRGFKALTMRGLADDVSFRFP